MRVRVGRFRTDVSMGGLRIVAIYLHLLLQTTSKKDCYERNDGT
jgi:hypothetical protein